MPNWIEGTFRARGKKQNVINFVLKGIYPVGSFGEKQEYNPTIDDGEDYIEINCDTSFSFYLRNTRRHFLDIDCDSISIDWNEDKNYYLVTNFKAAWYINEDEIADIAKTYNIDIKVNGYERGTCFSQLIEVDRNGNLLKNETKKYDNYQWDCDMPLLGG